MTESDKLYLSAREAAAELGVSMATLYTYASRRLLRVSKEPGRRESRYWRSDVERMKGAMADVGIAALLSHSAITLVTDTGTYYRGRDVAELAETCSLEDVAALLWDMDRDMVFGAAPPMTPRLDPGFRRQIAGLDLADRIAALVPFMERANPASLDPTAAGFAKAGGGMLRWAAGLMIGREEACAEPIHLQLVEAVPKANRAAWAEVTRRLLVLCADHDLDPTTLTARTLANTGVSPYRVLVAAMTTGNGRRGVQVRQRAAARLLAEVERANDPTAPIRARMYAGEPVPGFGPYIHEGPDSRVEAILSAYERFLPNDPDVARFLEIAAMVREGTGLEPQFILALSVFNRKLARIHPDLGLLRLARITGWIAHALEQSTLEVVRPRTRYSGKLPE